MPILDLSYSSIFATEILRFKKTFFQFSRGTPPSYPCVPDHLPISLPFIRALHGPNARVRWQSGTPQIEYVPKLSEKSSQCHPCVPNTPPPAYPTPEYHMGRCQGTPSIHPYATPRLGLVWESAWVRRIATENPSFPSPCARNYSAKFATKILRPENPNLSRK